MSIVWKNILDNKYRVEVERTDSFSGELKIFDGVDEKAKVLYREKVTISYNAIFGPDVADVSLWEDKVINFIDSLK